MAAWLAYRVGVSYRTGAELARVGSALESMPAMGGAFEDGSLSFDRVAALTKLATPATDKALAAEAVGWVGCPMPGRRPPCPPGDRQGVGRWPRPAVAALAVGPR